MSFCVKNTASYCPKYRIPSVGATAMLLLLVPSIQVLPSPDPRVSLVGPDKDFGPISLPNL